MRKLVVLALLGCGSSSAGLSPEQRGRDVYMTSCIACHSPDPGMPGSLGPAIKGSSRELLEARVLRGDYPAGYKPKRTTRAMAALPQLASSIDDLAAYLK